MSHGGGGAAQPSCTTMPLGKKVRRALRAAIGMQKKKPKDKPKKKKKNKLTKDAAAGSGSSSTELMSSFSKEEAGAARKESVVRVVLSSGVVEVYPGVVLACTVIRKHPPGLCLAHPDVFRNPHGAVLRPLEPLFPGQKFLLIPWSTVDKLKHKIPESSIGAFADDEEEEDTGSEEEASSSASTGTDQAAVAEEDDEAAAAAGDFMPACSAREFFVARDRWSECRFRKLVAQGLAVEPSTDDDDQPEMGRKKQKGKKKKRRGIKAGNKKRREQRRPAAPPAVLLRAFATPRTRTWEPSLPPVMEEENAAVSPLDHHPSETEASSTDMMMHEQYVS